MSTFRNSPEMKRLLGWLGSCMPESTKKGEAL